MNRQSKIRRGAVVQMHGMHGKEGRGVVVRLVPWDDFSCAYGRQAVVQFYHHGEVYTKEMGVGDLRYLGRVKHMPKIGAVTFPPHPHSVAHHERTRDVRRRGQGDSYDPTAPHNLPYERPLPGDEREVVLAVHRRRSRRR
jgi:hypothetical protein